MTRPSPRLPVFLLVFLLVTWGTCPCVLAQMLGGVLGGGAEADAAAEQGSASTAPC